MTDAGLSFDVSDVNRVAASFDASQLVVRTRAASLTKHYGHILRARVRGHASGRPGPRVVTGDYRRGINVRFRFTPSTYEATAGTNSPQGRRLEMGFNDVDALGRHFNQQPYPHFGPALDEVSKPFTDAVSALVAVGPVFSPGVDIAASRAARVALRRQQT